MNVNDSCYVSKGLFTPYERGRESAKYQTKNEKHQRQCSQLLQLSPQCESALSEKIRLHRG